ncbi:allene oxide synthase 3-like [Rhodamnia argentea]|uniref:Allene oxide synthase 3-like n=1 Tax=Rhodamnia argentea TaxID=178133 RepID=A0A8B8NRB4_9MYRT|nr:allene oxide synthase 3-like [Rhodamnia argentea]
MSSSPFHGDQISKASRDNAPPLKEIPGGYGTPFFGAIKDRLDYFYNQGREEFFRHRMLKYDSTVFRVNMPPGPFVASNPKVIVLLDAASFPVLFDTSKVEKRDVLDGTYMPSLDYFGGHRVCAFLDPSEPKHAVLKQFVFSVLVSRHGEVVPLFRNCLSELFVVLEDELASKGKAYFNTLSDKMSFDFVFRLFCDKKPHDATIEAKGSQLFDSWLFFQLAPLMTLGLTKAFNFLEDILLHTFPLLPFLAKSHYRKLYKALNENATSILDEAEGLGIKRDEACHNLVFVAGFNAYGGMKTTFPALIKWVASGGEKLHRQLANEIRSVVESEGGITLTALDNMSLTKSSVVYEALRIDPPVQFQYGKAKRDMVVRSHDAAFEIKKGEILFGYQPFATKDPKVFDDPEDFVGHRFVAEGEKLLKYVYWSNGREIDDPTVANKQCAGKDLVLLTCRVILVELFLRYDAFDVECGTLPVGSSVTFKSLTKASGC